jgi:hypothetical protein
MKPAVLSLKSKGHWLRTGQVRYE